LLDDLLNVPAREGAALLERYCAQEEIGIVVPADMVTTLRVAEMKLAVPSVFPLAGGPLLRELDDKARFQRLVRACGLRTPRTQLLTPDCRCELPYPVMLKPTAASGGFGVARCGSSQAIQAVQLRFGASVRHWLVQEFIPGRDVGINVLADHGRVVAITLQRRSEHGCVEFVRDERMLHVAHTLVEATRFHGIANFDLRIDERDGALHVLECNPRVWGSLRFSVAAGVNFIELGLRMALGRTVPATPLPLGLVRYPKGQFVSWYADSLESRLRAWVGRSALAPWLRRTLLRAQELTPHR
jgi:predicted ATP-grasp superfamily ATP-dependent carboligase